MDLQTERKNSRILVAYWPCFGEKLLFQHQWKVGTATGVIMKEHWIISPLFLGQNRGIFLRVVVHIKLVVGSVFKALKNDLLLYCSGSSKRACSIVYIFMAILFIRPGYLVLQGKAFCYRIAEVMFMFFMFQTLLGILAKGKRRQRGFPRQFSSHWQCQRCRRC